MASGMKPNKQVIELVGELNKKQRRYVIMGFDRADKKAKEIIPLAWDEVGVQATGQEAVEDNAWFNRFQAAMEEHKDKALWVGLFLTYFLSASDRQGTDTYKVLVFSYADDNLCIGQQKMMMSSSNDAVKKACEGFNVFSQINDFSEVELSNLIDIASNGRTK